MTYHTFIVAATANNDPAPAEVAAFMAMAGWRKLPDGRVRVIQAWADPDGIAAGCEFTVEIEEAQDES